MRIGKHVEVASVLSRLIISRSRIAPLSLQGIDASNAVESSDGRLGEGVGIQLLLGGTECLGPGFANGVVDVTKRGLNWTRGPVECWPLFDFQRFFASLLIFGLLYDLEKEPFRVSQFHPGLPSVFHESMTLPEGGTKTWACKALEKMGILTRGSSVKSPPASRTRTDVLGSSERRAATTSPAVPAPTTTKPYEDFIVPVGSVMGRRRLEDQRRCEVWVHSNIPTWSIKYDELCRSRTFDDCCCTAAIETVSCCKSSLITSDQ